MKTESFIAGALLGAAAAVVVSKKFLNKCPVCGGDIENNPTVKAAKDNEEQMRGSVDYYRKQFEECVSDKNTLEAKCNELNDTLKSKEDYIKKLEDNCAALESSNKKLEG